MAEITLLRHGQASFGADNYDNLSDLGHQQARWLGEYLHTCSRGFDRIVMGSMVRHRQTAEGLLQGLQSDQSLEIHEGLNEYDFQGLLEALKDQNPDAFQQTGHAKRDYFHNIKRAMNEWMSGAITSDGHDTWQSFRHRISAALEEACNTSAKRILLVTSGGPIAVILGKVLELAPARICDISLQIKNTSTSKLLYNRVNFTLDSFNDVGHLMAPDKHNYITFS